jgi:hypothetical protein
VRRHPAWEPQGEVGNRKKRTATRTIIREDVLTAWKYAAPASRASELARPRAGVPHFTGRF